MEKDRDVEGLMKCCEGLEMTQERMRHATIEFLWDKFVLQPIRDKKKERGTGA